MSTGEAGRGRRPGRPRGGRAVLTRQAILAAALKLVDTEGIEALSMRRLAGRLGVDPMSIYHHVPNKQALLSGLVEVVFSQLPPPGPPDAAWRDQVRAWARGYRDLALTHPGLVLHIVTDAAAASEASIRVGEPLYAAFESAGLTPREVVTAVGALVDFVHGYVLGAAGAGPAAGNTAGTSSDAAGTPSGAAGGGSGVDDSRAGSGVGGGGDGPDPMGALLAAVGDDVAPAMRRIHAALAATAPEADGDAYFAACVELILRGAVPE